MSWIPYQEGSLFLTRPGQLFFFIMKIFSTFDTLNQLLGGGCRRGAKGRQQSK